MNTENKLIAEFMGVYQDDKGYWGFTNTKEHQRWHIDRFLDATHYDNDWNWLMEVVEKIENIEDKNRCSKYNFEMVQTFVEIIDNNNSDTIVEIDKNTKIQATYKAVVEFIKWYNEQK